MIENKEYIIQTVDNGTINISPEVVAVCAASAALEIDGVAGLAMNAGRNIAEVIGRKGMLRAVKVTIGEEGVVVDVNIMVKMGCAINKVGHAVQSRVAGAVEAATGVSAKSVNIHVCGIELENK